MALQLFGVFIVFKSLVSDKSKTDLFAKLPEDEEDFISLP